MKKMSIIFALVFFSTLAFANYSTDVETKYPIVLIHGLFGFGDRLSFIARYWGDVPELLRESGATVYVADVSQAHLIKWRGLQLYRQLKWWGHKKYNLIGHSHGGLDARYVLATHPEIVASVTTIGTPNRGSKVADELVSTWEGTIAGYLLHAVGDLFSHTISFLSGLGLGLEQNSSYAVHGLTTEALSKFNTEFPLGMGAGSCDEGAYEDEGRKFYSWGSYGVVAASSFDVAARFFEYFSHAFAPDELNDGLVAVCSMKFGKWLGARARAHHLIPVGGVIAPVLDEHRDYSKEMFMNHAHRLKTDGL